VAPLFSVISRKEFLEERKPSPLLLYSIAGVAASEFSSYLAHESMADPDLLEPFAARRDVPRDVFNALRTTINGIIKVRLGSLR
jgi:hypothetical protein